MRRAALALGLLLLAMFAFGPRAQLDPERVAPPEVPTIDALDGALRDREAAAGPLTPGTEARVVWRAETRARRPWAVVYLHGFSATRQETAPLAARVAEQLDAHLFEARFTGHGLPGEALAEATAEDWLADARAALAIGARLGEQVLVLASSTGATLAWLAAVEGAPPAVAGYAFLSPNFGPRDGASELLLWPWAERWVPLVIGAERSWTPANEAQGRFWTTRYPVRALFPMMAAVDAARRAPASAVETPVAVWLHPDDDVVSPEATRAALAEAPQVEFHEVGGPGDTHVLAGDVLSPERTGALTLAISRWARALASAGGS